MKSLNSLRALELERPSKECGRMNINTTAGDTGEALIIGSPSYPIPRILFICSN